MSEVKKPSGNGRAGFLPIHTNAFDRGFIAVVAFVAIHLFWMRFLEARLSLYIATAAAIVIGWLIVTRG
jgi:predicted small integral membrane protein